MGHKRETAYIITDDKPVFICEVKPLKNGGWDVWIREEPSILNSHERFVGSYFNKKEARKAAIEAMHNAEQGAINLARETFTMRSDELEKP